MKKSAITYSGLVFIISLFILFVPLISNSQTIDSGNTFNSHVIAFSNTPPDDNNEIYIINSDGTGLQRLTNRPGRDAGPDWSPDATQIAFYTHFDNLNTWSIFKMLANGNDIVRLTNTAGVFDSSPNWSPDGLHIMFTREYPPVFNAEIWFMNADGSNIQRIVEDGLGGVWSPDGTQIAYCSQQDGDFEIYLMNSNGSGLLKLTDNDADDLWPSWSPDGNWIVFQSDRANDMEIYKMIKDGTEQTRLTNNPAIDAGPDWSPDGDYIAFSSTRNGGNYKLYIMNSNGTNQIQLLTNLQVHNIQPDWKPEITSEIDIQDSESEIIKGFRLFQNYPNPFNPTTTIKYSLPKETKVVLKIFNLHGQEVRTLVNEIQSSGSEYVVWDGKDNSGYAVSSGVYFYGIQTGRIIKSKKMLLVR